VTQGGSDTILEMVVGYNTTSQPTCEVKIVPTYKNIVRSSLIRC